MSVFVAMINPKKPGTGSSSYDVSLKASGFCNILDLKVFRLRVLKL